MDNLAVIRAAMVEREIKYLDLAKLTGIHASLIGRYLRGEIAIGMKNAPKIASALGLDVRVVMFGAAAA